LTALLFSRERRRGEREEDMTESLKSTPGGEWLDELEIGAPGPADAECVRPEEVALRTEGTVIASSAP
jgi:hypothetical protein